jgi:hypothetical protein
MNAAPTRPSETAPSISTWAAFGRPVTSNLLLSGCPQAAAQFDVDRTERLSCGPQSRCRKEIYGASAEGQRLIREGVRSERLWPLVFIANWS